MTYDGKATAERAAHTITPGPGQELLLWCLSRFPDSAFQGEDAQEELGDLLMSDSHVTMPPREEH